VIAPRIKRPGVRTLSWASVLSPDFPARFGSPSALRNGGDVFTYRLQSPDGDDLGEATYAVPLEPGEEILLGTGRPVRVVDVIPFDEADESPFVGLLQVESV
jgi:hypothetical protein